MQRINSQRRRSEQIIVVSFSGIDGAGKTTQIEALTHWLLAAGLHVELLTFWDNVVVLPRFRERMSYRAFKGEQGVGSPEKPLNRRDKNVTSWPVSAMRFFLYALDALNVWRKVQQSRQSDADVVIFDRYIYDELANLPLKRWWTRAYIRLLLQIIPVPDVAYVIDADPVAACARKPEYPLEFLRRNREAYIAMSHLAGSITVIDPLPISAAELKVREAFLQRSPRPGEQFSGLPAVQ
jgi:thymidylate kinase